MAASVQSPFSTPRPSSVGSASRNDLRSRGSTSSEFDVFPDDAVDTLDEEASKLTSTTLSAHNRIIEASSQQSSLSVADMEALLGDVSEADFEDNPVLKLHVQTLRRRIQERKDRDALEARKREAKERAQREAEEKRRAHEAKLARIEVGMLALLSRCLSKCPVVCEHDVPIAGGKKATDKIAGG